MLRRTIVRVVFNDGDNVHMEFAPKTNQMNISHGKYTFHNYED